MDSNALHCDVVVAGAGFGGLTTSILLARMGFRVVLVEAERVVGGYLRSYQRDGVECPVGVHYFGSAGPNELLGQFLELAGVRDTLRLRRIGTDGVIDRYHFEHFSCVLPSTLDGFAAQLRTLMPEAPEAVEAVVDMMRTTMKGLRIDSDGKVQSGSLGAAGLTRSAAEVLDELGCPRMMHEILSVQGFWTGSELVACPVQYPFMSIGSLLMSAWELGCSGAHMADALGAQARAHGVRIITGDRAAGVLVQGGKAAGLRLQSGTTIEASFVIGGMHPKQMLGLVPEGVMAPAYRDGVMQLKETPGTFAVVALLDAERHPALPYNVLRVRRAATPEQDGMFIQLRPSGKPGWNRLLLLGKSEYDDWKPWHGTRTGERGQDYVARKMGVAAEFLALAQEHIGPVHEPRILDVWTPLSARDWVNAPDGGAYGLRHSLRDGVEYMVLARTQLDRLFLVGQSVLAPGLLGVALGVLRVTGMVAGRQKLQAFLVEALRERKEAQA